MDDFVAKDKDLRKFEMHTNDWDAIVLVAQWLKSFRSATTQMATTKRPMLSSTYAIYRGLQESLWESLRNLPILYMGFLCAVFFFIDVEFANLFGDSVGPTDFVSGPPFRL